MQPNQPSHQTIQVHQLVMKLLDSYEQKFAVQNISVDTDVDHVQATIDTTLIHSAAQSLVDNAIHSMPEGGEISVTLIDGKYQWELEIADTSSHSASNTQHLPNTPLPTATEYLQSAYRDASAHGGEIQTWKCPLGGVAHVLAIPRRDFMNSQLTTNQSRNS